MYGSHLNARELTLSARVVNFNQIQTSKIHQVFNPAHDTMSSPVKLHSTYTFDVATAFMCYLDF